MNPLSSRRFIIRECLDQQDGNPSKAKRKEIESKIDSIMEKHTESGSVCIREMMQELDGVEEIEDPRAEFTITTNADGKVSVYAHVHFIYVKSDVRFSSQSNWKEKALRAKRTREIK